MSFGELVALIARSLDYQNVSIQNFNTFTTRSSCSQALYDDEWKAYFMTITVDKYNKKNLQQRGMLRDLWQNGAISCLNVWLNH